jgi:excisionase family DNA binding protein
MKEYEGWITLEEAAIYLSTSRSFLYQKGKCLGIPRVKLGSKYRYRKSDLDTWLKAQTEGEGE